MKKSTLAAQGGTGIVVLALLSALAQADSVQYSDISTLELQMADAVVAASGAIAGDVIEAEFEMNDAKAIWEIDIVNEANEVVTIEIDGQTGQILSTDTDDDSAPSYPGALSLAKAIELVLAVEKGALVEAELEHENGKLIWEVETLGNSSQESKFRIDAETGEILT